MDNLELNNKLIQENHLKNKQRSFLQSNIGKAVNVGVDIGIRCLLPDLIENQVIDIKNSMIHNGFKDGIRTAIDSVINLGKSTIGIFNGNFENIEQIQNVIRSGGIIDSVSQVLDYTLDKIMNRGKMSYNIGHRLKRGKNIILDNISRNIESQLENQINYIEKLEKNINNWNSFYSKKDMEGMEKEYKKIKVNISKIVPLEITIKNARRVENLHQLIKNNGGNFNLTENQKELANIL